MSDRTYGQFTLSKVEDGKSVTVLSTEYEYKLSTSGTTPPSGTWEKNPVAPTASQYAWTKTTVTFSDGNKSITYTVGGKTGTNGTSVTILEPEENWYQKSTSGTDIPTGAWSSTPIEPTETEYVWTKTIIHFSNGSDVTTYTVGGKTGQTGPKGKGISKIETQYYLSTSNTKQEGGSWNATPAAYVSGRYYWRRDHIIWTEGAPTDTTAVLDNALTTANKNAYDAQYAVDNMEIGGRNLVLGTSSEWYAFNVSDGVNKCLPVFGYPNQTGGYLEVPSILGIKAGDQIQVSFDIKFSENWAATGTGTSRSLIQGSANNPNTWGGLSYTAKGAGGGLETELVEAMSSSNKTAHLSTWFVVVGQHLDGTYTGRTLTNIRFDYYSGTAYIRNVMVEKASKPSAWSPAPEDLEAGIDNALSRGVEYIVGSQSAQTNDWRGVTTDSTLETGKTIAYYLPYAGTSTPATLNLTLSTGIATGAKPVKINDTAVTTHYPAGAIIKLTFDGTSWKSDNYSVEDRLQLNSAVVTASAISADRIVCSEGNGYKQIAAGVTFDISYPLLYSPQAIATNTETRDLFLTYPNVNATSNGSVQGGASGKTLFLKGTLDEGIFTISSSPFLTTVAPTSAGSYYIPIGTMTSPQYLNFESSNKLYTYVIPEGSTTGSFQAVGAAGNLLAFDTIARLKALEPIVNNHTSSLNVLEKNILSEVSNSYVSQTELDTYYEETIKTQINQTEKDVMVEVNRVGTLINGDGTEENKGLRGEFDDFTQTINKFFLFNGDGLTIGSKENALKLVLDNDDINFYNGDTRLAYWDGETLHTGNVEVERFKLGKFIANPRQDGSVVWNWDNNS